MTSKETFCWEIFPCENPKNPNQKKKNEKKELNRKKRRKNLTTNELTMGNLDWSKNPIMVSE